MKCPFDKELGDAKQVVVEVSNGGRRFSMPIVYFPGGLRREGVSKGDEGRERRREGTESEEEKEDGDGAELDDEIGNEKKGRDVGKAEEKDDKNGSTTSEEDGHVSLLSDTNEGKEKEKDEGLMGKSSPNERGKEEKKPNEEDQMPPLGPTSNSPAGMSTVSPHRKPLQATMDIFKNQPHYFGIAAASVGVFVIAAVYMFCNRRSRNDTVYSRVRTSDGNEVSSPTTEAGRLANGNQSLANGNRNAFDLYDDDEEEGSNAAGWGDDDWDNDWEKDEGGENANGNSKAQSVASKVELGEGE